MNEELKHTPGPWKFSTQTHFSGGAPYSESVYVTMGEETLTIGCHTGTPNQEVLKANAKLIAVAPELLEAAIALVGDKWATDPLIKRLQDVIEKATE